MEVAPPPASEPDPQPPAPPPTLAEQIIRKLGEAATPLAFAAVKKGLPKPKKVSAPVFDANVREALVAATRAGRAFVYPSGKGGAERYWGKDEKHAIREEALRRADTPDTLAALVKKAATPKADAAFAEDVIRDLIAEERLHEHPPAKKGKNAAARFGVRPPPPPPPPPHPLTVGRAKTAFASFLKAARKLLDLPGVELDELLSRTRAELVPADPSTAGEQTEPGTHPAPVRPADADVAAVGGLILDVIRGQSVASLADVRRAVPAEHRGPAFDAAVLDLSRQSRVILYQDASPEQFTAGQRAELVTDGTNVFTTISPRG